LIGQHYPSNEPKKLLYMNKLLKPVPPPVTAKAVVLIRLMVGGVFLVEGLLKFLHPE
jgi:hypothetical protein